eukprot:gene11349-13200_t
MSTMNDAAKTEGYMKTCTRLVSFRMPICKPTTDFTASLKSSMGTPEAAQLVQSLTDARSEMISTYQSSSTIEVKIKAVENYIPLLYRLLESVNATDKLTLDKELTFEWLGAISNKGEYFKSHDILFELIMVLHTKAIFHAIAAYNLVTVDPLTFVSESGKHLLEAASVMNLLAGHISSGTWRRQFNRRLPNPPEVCEHVCASMALMFKGQAQSMAFMKSTSSGAAPATIKARLAVGVVNSMTAAFNTLCGASEATSLYGDYLAHMHITRQVYAALAYMHAAQAYVDKTEVGNAIAFCEAAKSRLLQQKANVRPIWSAAGLPKFTGPYVELGNAAAYLTDAINQMQKQAEQDNKFVYFQPVPGPNSSNSTAGLPLPDLPLEASVMNPAPFPEPTSTEPPVRFVYVAKPSIFSSMMSSLIGGGSGASAAPGAAPAAAGSAEQVPPSAPGAVPGAAPSVPPPVTAPGGLPSAPPLNPAGYSDETYARYLQTQYDAEAGSGKGPPLPTPKYNSLV